jgi:hypothetical protein
MIAAIIVASAAVIALVVVLVVVLLPGTHSTASPPTSGVTAVTGTTTTTTTTTAPANIDAQQAASSVNSYLTSSAGDRTQVLNSTAAIANCNNLTEAVQTLNMAATDRQNLANKLQSITIPNIPNWNQIVSSLVSALQISATSDQSYAQWGQNEQSFGCTQNDTSNSNYQNAQNTDAQASSEKQSFVNLWNPVASTYGLQQWSPSQF